MTSLIETTNFFHTNDGLKIFYRHVPVKDERCRMVITHGLGMNSNCYQNAIEYLVPRGISIWAFDLRGNGQSEGIRGHINAFDEYLSDLKIMMELANQKRKNGLKTFLLGDSMGGLIVLNFALRFPEIVDGVIAASPGLGGAKVSAVKLMIGKILSGFFPTFSLATGLNIAKSCHDKDWIKSFENDPLHHDRATARFATELLATQTATYKEMHKLKVPVLMQVPGDDYLVDANISKEFYNQLKLDDKTLHFYDTLFHFIYNEPPDMRAVVLEDLAKWIEDHI